MRKLAIRISIMVVLVLATSPASAQRPQTTSTPNPSTFDIPAIAESTLNADLDTMISNLEHPIPNANLPARFSSAEYVDAADATDQDLILPMEDLAFAEGSIGFNVDYEPQSRGLSIGLASLNFILVDGEITDDDMEDFREGATEGSEDDEVTVEDIEISGVAGVVVSVEVEEDGILSIVEMIALPVGNTMVLSMVVAASDDPTLDNATVRADAESLLLSGIDHLGAAAQDAQ